MVKILFSLRFQSQLRRTKPKLLRGLEKIFIETFEGFGAKVETEQKMIIAVFSKKTIGFWLDIYCVLETIQDVLKKASSELFGHICIIGENLNEEDMPFLLRAFPLNPPGTGIWCAPELQHSLEPYIEFSKPLETNKNVIGYAQIRSIRNLINNTKIQTREKNNSEKIRSYLKQGSSRNVIIVGDEHIGKHEGLYRYCKEQMKGFPPLLVRFKEGENIITSFLDAFTPEIRALFREKEETSQKTKENEFLELGNILFLERLRDELSDFSEKRGEYFFSILLEMYRQAAEKQSHKPMLILENIQNAKPRTRAFISDIYFSYPARERLKMYGTATKLKGLEFWEELFPRIIKFTPEKVKPLPAPVLSGDLEEMRYCLMLFKRYFPPFLFPQLLQEEGKNPVMIEKAMAILSQLESDKGAYSLKQSEDALGKNAENVRAIVRRRLLSWVQNFRLLPCFSILISLVELSSRADDNLILNSISADIINGTFQSIEKAIREENFSTITGMENKTILLGIIKTLKALNHGNKEEILEAFKDVSISGSEAPCFKVIVLTNLASYYFSISDTHTAMDSVKEAMLLSQKENSGQGLARIYRLFSLVEFVNQRLSDALDYFTFALENAEKSKDRTELGISTYYAAVVSFIFGNISKARKLAIDAREAAIEAILPGWADRSRFLEGRICFETGLYEEALDIFKELLEEHIGPHSESFEHTVSAWAARADTYLNNTMPKYSKSHTAKGPDARLFEAEAAFLTGNFQKALELVDKLEETIQEEHFIFIEQPDWRSGFYQCELLLFPLKDLWNRMIHTIRTLTLCHINEKGKKEMPKALNTEIQEMQRIIRSELPETDPNDSFYLYSYYRILKKTDAPEVDLNTAISIAFKRLQKRASRIEDNKTRRTFLSTHSWNSALTAAAKEHKLI